MQATLALTRRDQTERWLEFAGWLALAALLGVGVPLFLSMPLTPDAAFYDIAAQDVLRGGAPEKDFLFLPPPGLVWAFALVRALFGQSTLVLRAADLAVWTGVIALLMAWLRVGGLSRAVCIWSGLLCFAFFLSATEYIQVQPDTWMLLPALSALHLRRLRTRSLTLAAQGLAPRWSVAEGMLWGSACLIKFHAVVPGCLVWLVSAVLAFRAGFDWRRRLFLDALGLLAGGLLIGACGRPGSSARAPGSTTGAMSESSTAITTRWPQSCPCARST